MLQINVCLLDKLIEDLSFKHLWCESLVGFLWIVDQRLIPLDDDAPGIQKCRKKLRSLFNLTLRSLCPDALETYEREDQAERETCFRENDHEHLRFLIVPPPEGTSLDHSAEELA